MPDDSAVPLDRPLEPGERVAEALFGLIMVLTFTCSLSVAEAGRDDVRTMLIGALGCNIAWGVIDALFYLMHCLGEQGRGIRALRALHRSSRPEDGQRVIAETLPPLVAAAMRPEELEPLRQRLIQLPEHYPRPQLGRREWLAALAVFLWVFVMTLPVVIPFTFMENLHRAMRLSNAIAVTLLFIAGYAFGRLADYRPWVTGLAMVAIGLTLVALTIALGG